MSLGKERSMESNAAYKGLRAADALAGPDNFQEWHRQLCAYLRSISIEAFLHYETNAAFVDDVNAHLQHLHDELWPAEGLGGGGGGNGAEDDDEGDDEGDRQGIQLQRVGARARAFVPLRAYAANAEENHAFRADFVALGIKATSTSAEVNAIYEKANHLCLSLILSNVKDNLRHIFEGVPLTAFEYWSAVKRHFHHTSFDAGVQRLRERLTMEPSEDVAKYCNRVREHADRLHELGLVFNDKTRISLLLGGLSEKFALTKTLLIQSLNDAAADHHRDAVKQEENVLANRIVAGALPSNTYVGMTFEQVKSRLVARELQLGKEHNMVFFYGNCHNCGKSGHRAADCRKKHGKKYHASNSNYNGNSSNSNGSNSDSDSDNDSEEEGDPSCADCKCCKRRSDQTSKDRKKKIDYAGSSNGATLFCGAQQPSFRVVF